MLDPWIGQRPSATVRSWVSSVCTCRMTDKQSTEPWTIDLGSFTTPVPLVRHRLGPRLDPACTWSVAAHVCRTSVRQTSFQSRIRSLAALGNHRGSAEVLCAAYCTVAPEKADRCSGARRRARQTLESLNGPEGSRRTPAAARQLRRLRQRNHAEERPSICSQPRYVGGRLHRGNLRRRRAAVPDLRPWVQRSLGSNRAAARSVGGVIASAQTARRGGRARVVASVTVDFGDEAVSQITPLRAEIF